MTTTNAGDPTGTVGATVETITPAIAAQLLTLNHGNRLPSKRHVARLAEDMKAGEFVLTGEPIILARDRLLDGQHRLLACVRSGVTIQSLVVRGVSEDVMPMIDAGHSRSLADALRWKNTPNATKTAAVAKRLAVLLDGANLRDSATIALYTNQRVMPVAEIYSDEIQTALSRGARINRVLGCGRAAWALPLCWVAVQTGETDPDGDLAEFAALLATGAGLELGSPILALRAWAMAATAKRRTMRRDEVLIATVRSYNLFVAGQELRILRIPANMELPEVTR